MTEIAKGAVDKVLEKIVSRKLLVWATATALMFTFECFIYWRPIRNRCNCQIKRFITTEAKLSSDKIGEVIQPT